MERLIVKSDSPLSLLQQRLNYTDQYPDREYTWLLENVPKWPELSLPAPTVSRNMVTAYDNCQGNTDLREAVCRREAAHYGLAVTPDQVLISNGAFHGISLITRYLGQAGGVALCQYPVLDSVEKLLLSAGYEIQEFHVNDGRLNQEDFASKCSKDAKLVYLNQPHNPLGEMLAPEELRVMLNIAQCHGTVVIADLVYDAFLFEGKQPVNPLLHTQQWDNLYVLNSMSKGYGVPGLRVGWTVSAAQNIEQLTSNLEAECISVCTASQQYAAGLLDHGNVDLVERVQTHWSLVNELLQQLPGAKFTSPEGGTQYFVQMPVDDIEAFADYMLVEYGLVLVTSGNYFAESRPCIRFPIGHKKSVLEKGLVLLKQGLASWQHCVDRNTRLVVNG